MGPMSLLGPYLTAAEIGAGVVALGAIFGAGYHLGAAGVHDADDKAHAAQMGKVVQVFEQREVAAEAELDRRQRIIDRYDAHKNDAPSVIVAGLGERVRIDSGPALCAALPALPAVDGGDAAPAALPAGDAIALRVSELNQAVYDACEADARQMKAMIELATPAAQ